MAMTNGKAHGRHFWSHSCLYLESIHQLAFTDNSASHPIVGVSDNVAPSSHNIVFQQLAECLFVQLIGGLLAVNGVKVEMAAPLTSMY